MGHKGSKGSKRNRSPWTGARLAQWLEDARALAVQLPSLTDIPHRQLRLALLAVARSLDGMGAPADNDPTGTAAAERLRIFTLGPFRIERDAQLLEFPHKLPRKPLDLLKILLAHGGRSVPQEKIGDQLWPDADGATAQHTFKVTLHRLRQILGIREAIECHNGQVSLDPGYCWVDLWAFERIVDSLDHVPPTAKALDASGTERFDHTLDLYQGPFLMQYADAWLLPMRERLRAKFIRSVRAYSEHFLLIGHAELAARIYERAIEIDPQAEELYRRLMACDALLGRASEALEVFHRCQHALRGYLGVDPGAETLRLYRSLLEGIVADRKGAPARRNAA